MAATASALYRTFHYRWSWLVGGTPERLWPLIADTNRFNRDVGLPAVEMLGGGAGMRRLRLFRHGVAIEWEEEPFEWIRPKRFGVRRRYVRGPVAEMRVQVKLRAEQDGTRVTYHVWATPRNVLGIVGIPVEIGIRSARRFEAAIRRYGEIAGAPAAALVDPPGSVRFAPGGQERLMQLAAARRDGATDALVQRLVETIERTDDVTAARLRPYALADAWGVPRRAVLELCLECARSGLLDAQWEVLCPMCRGASVTLDGLAGTGDMVHCASCNIDYRASFDRSVELTFRPNPAIRTVHVAPYCTGGPQVTPHIVMQQQLAEGDRRALTPVLEPGRYRLRTAASAGALYVEVADDGAADALVRLDAGGWGEETLRIAPRPRLLLENGTSATQVMVLERTAWSDQAVTAAEVTTLQRFRDLFGGDVLRAGETVSVGSLAVVFTDLRDSTRLYREIGDAPAFGRVMNHFDIVRTAFGAEGVVVKTIGDAVMGAFRRPAAAIRALLEAQRQLLEADAPLVLKAGVHYGPCIAVTLNDRLDYFGSTVNQAARLAGLTGGGEVVVSESVWADPEVQSLLGGGELVAEVFECELRGFDDERFRLWRVRGTGTG